MTSVVSPEVQGGRVLTAIPRAPGVTRQVSRGILTEGLMMLAWEYCSSRKRASVPGALARDIWGRWWRRMYRGRKNTRAMVGQKRNEIQDFRRDSHGQ